jgi:hypothetical protein
VQQYKGEEKPRKLAADDHPTQYQCEEKPWKSEVARSNNIKVRKNLGEWGTARSRGKEKPY